MNFLLVVVLVVLLIMWFNKQPCGCPHEGFSLSKKPMEHDNNLYYHNPFDDIDYVTPAFYPKL